MYFLFYFGFVTPNKALDIVKLVVIFFFNQRLYGVNFKRINNGLQCEVDNFDGNWPEKFSKNLKIDANEKKSVSALSIWRGLPHIHVYSIDNI